MKRIPRSAPSSGRLVGLAAILAILLAPAPARAAGAAAGDNAVEILTLDGALAIARDNNRDVLKAMELRRRLEGKYVEERAAALPQVVVTGTVSRSGDEAQKAFFGTSRNDVYQAQAALAQPLFTYGQIGAAIRAARVGLATADDQLRVFRQAALRDVSAAFHDVVLARELRAIALQVRDQRERHLDEARKRNLAGTATDYDVLAAEVALRNAQPEVVRTENRVRSARDRLRFLLAIDDREVDVRGELEAEIAGYPRYEEALAAARANRPELSDMRHRLGVSKELITIAAAGNKPRLDLNAAAGWKENDIGIADASGSVWSAGVLLTWPLFNGERTRGQVAQARSEEAALRIEEAKLLDAIALECRDAVNAVRDAGEVVKALSGTVVQAERLLAMAEKGYEYGVKTKLEVDDAELALRQARGGLARARRDYLVARVNLAHATGTLGEEGGAAAGPAAREWRPAESPLGIVREVLSGEPRL
ncbi:MAG: TolC family protein [Gemmatimonadota bacterium]